MDACNVVVAYGKVLIIISPALVTAFLGPLTLGTLPLE